MSRSKSRARKSLLRDLLGGSPAKQRRSLRVEPLESRRLLAVAPVQLADINQNTADSNPGDMTIVGNTAFFRADNGTLGRELWKTDGTAAGTKLVKDIRPGNFSSEPSRLIEVNGTVFFTADDGFNGRELWKTNGTAAGTTLVKDIYPGFKSSQVNDLVAINDTLFFRADDGVNGSELWTSDGTAAGTTLVKDLKTNGNASPKYLTEFNGSLYFYRADNSPGRGLYKSNGTEAGTVLVKEGLIKSPLVEFDGELYFIGNIGLSEGLWKTDGTEAGTELVKQLTGSILNLTAANDRLYFNNRSNELWTSDGTETGTEMLTFVVGISGFTEFNGEVYFGGYELWKTNGTEAGTTMVKDIYPGDGNVRASRPHSLTTFNNALYFRANDGVHGNELWKTDGTEAGTEMVADIKPGIEGSTRLPLFELNGKLLFTANSNFGAELWTSDGTEDGTTLVIDLNQRNLGSNIREMTEAGNSLFFQADDGIHGRELWITDGTTGNTRLVKDILPANLGTRSNGGGSTPARLVNVDGTVYFNANDGVHGSELWKSDGTEAGTVLVKDIYPGTSSSRPNSGNPTPVIEMNGTLYFLAYDGNTAGLWKVSEAMPEPAFVAPGSFGAFTIFNGTLYYSGNDGTSKGLWKIDNATGQPVFISGAGTGSIIEFTEMNGKLYFAGGDSTTGRELWTSDGTAAGTVLVKDVLPGSGSSGPERLTNANGTLYFWANQNNERFTWELWKSNGTDAGTVFVKELDLNDSDEAASNGELFPFNDSIYFPARDEANGWEVWTSNGTANGTQMVVDINPGSGDSFRPGSSFTNVNGTLYFGATDGTNGRELWTTDGTANGTEMVADINPGSSSSGPDNFTTLNGKLLFTADNGTQGAELWRLLDLDDPNVLPEVTVGPGGGSINVYQDANNLVVDHNGVEVFSAALSTIAGLTVNGSSDSEDFVLNMDGINTTNLPNGITLNAGEDGPRDIDNLILNGSETVTEYQYTTTGRESGIISLDGLEIVFDEFEPIFDNLSVINRRFVIGTTEGQTIRVADDGVAGNGISIIDDAGTGTFESLAFKSPSNLFEITSSDQADQITIGTLDEEFGASLVVAAGGGDDSVDASTYDLAISISGGDGNDALTGGSGNDQIDGGDGNDVLDGGAGSDAVDGGAGNNDVVGDANDGNLTVNEEGVFQLLATFENPVSATIDWGDGTAIDAASVDPLTSAVSGSHAYLLAGEYLVTITATDGADVVSEQLVTVTVNSLVLGNGDVLFNSPGPLRIGGTSADDDIEVKAAGDGVNLSVSINGVVLRDDIPIADVSEIRVWGHAGDDLIRIVNLEIPSMLDGGAGDDELLGGAGNDLIFGGLGNDLLTGAAGNDFLVGGDDADRIIGSRGHDILVAGDIDDAFSEDALRAISEDWASGRTTDDTLDDSVIDESSLEAGADMLTGSSGSDWFIIDLLDKVTDDKKNNKDGDLITIV